MRMFAVVLMVVLCLPALGMAQAVPGAAQASAGTNWLGEVTKEVSDLVTTNADQLVQFGVIELAFFAILTLVRIVFWQAVSHMVVGVRPVNYTIGDYVVLLINLSAASLMLHYYNTPIPGTNLNVHSVFDELSSALVKIFDQKLVDDFLTRISTLISATKPPNPLNVLGVFIYGYVLIQAAVMSFIIFAVNSFGFIAQGLFVLFGPLFIPLYVTSSFRHKFWSWVDGLLSISMIRVVASGVTFIYVHMIIGFFDHSVAGDYSLGHWLGLLPSLTLLSGGFLFSMFLTPRLTSFLFGGVAASGQVLADTAMLAVRKAIG